MNDKVTIDSLQSQIEGLNRELATAGEQLKARADDARREMADQAKLSAETRVEVDKLLATQAELHSRLTESEQLVASLQSGGGPGAGQRPLSIGEQVTENEDLLSLCSNPARGKSVRVPVQAAITGGSAGGDMIQPQRLPGITPLGERRLTIRDLLTWGRTESSSVEFIRETGFSNAAAPVSENPADGKPESNITFELESAPVATIAHWIHASRQVLADMPMLQGYIDGRGRYGLKLVEENQLLTGSGVGLNIEGIYTQATAYVNPGVVVQAETRLDRLRLAMLQAELAEYFPNGIVLNPLDWAAIELTKDNDNGYVWANPQGGNTPVLWGRAVVPTQAMGAGDFLTGAFDMGAGGWDREDVSVMISLEDRDNVIKNMVTILIEERLALTVYRPESFIKGDFSGVEPSSGQA